MPRRHPFTVQILASALFVNLAAGAEPVPPGADVIESGFARPVGPARLRAYWWWLNGNVTRASITRDLGEMASKAFGGALICDAGGDVKPGGYCI